MNVNGGKSDCVVFVVKFGEKRCNVCKCCVKIGELPLGSVEPKM